MLICHPDQAPLRMPSGQAAARTEGSFFGKARSLDFATLRSGRRLVVSAAIVFVSTSAVAASGIEVKRGADRIEYGSCVPSLTVANNSGETIDYLQVDLAMTLADGRQRTVELKSAYREGIHYPIEPGGTATLRQHLDTEPALGVPCGDLKARRVLRTICQDRSGKACSSAVSVQP